MGKLLLFGMKEAENIHDFGGEKGRVGVKHFRLRKG